MDDDQKLEDVRKRLQKEKEIKAATMKLRDFQTSDAAKAACDATMEESQQRINYFQNEFDKLQLKKQQENSTKVARTHIPITLPSLENAPPMFKAGFESSRGGSYQSTSSSSDNNNTSRMGPSRNNSITSSHYPEDFISSRPLSTVGKSSSLSKHLVVSLSVFSTMVTGLDWSSLFLVFIIRKGKAGEENAREGGCRYTCCFIIILSPCELN